MRKTQRGIKSIKSYPKRPAEVCEGGANAAGLAVLREQVDEPAKKKQQRGKLASGELTKCTAAINSNETNESIELRL